MGTRRHPRGSPLYTRWALEWRGDDPRLSQFLRATNYDKLSEYGLRGILVVIRRSGPRGYARKPGKQAKLITPAQEKALLGYVATKMSQRC
jgi:hypothetical protein